MIMFCTWVVKAIEIDFPVYSLLCCGMKTVHSKPGVQ